MVRIAILIILFIVIPILAYVLFQRYHKNQEYRKIFYSMICALVLLLSMIVFVFITDESHLNTEGYVPARMNDDGSIVQPE